MGRQLERLDYRILRPRATHTRPATCEEAACEWQRDGWVSAIDERTPAGQAQAHHIRTSGRSFTTEAQPDGLTWFLFPAGQTCFAAHRIDVEREPRYVRLASHSRTYNHTAASWVDDQATELNRLATFIERHG